MLRATAPGDLLTYGQVAVLAGHIGGARAVGHVLALSDDLPWCPATSCAKPSCWRERGSKSGTVGAR